MKSSTGTLKRNSSSLKSGGRIQARKKTQEDIDAQKEVSARDKEFYESIWQSREHRCEVHDGYKFLGYEMKKSFMDHAIEKSTYPEYRYEPLNIVLCCGDCHFMKTSGFPTGKHQLRIQEIKQLLLSRDS